MDNFFAAADKYFFFPLTMLFLIFVVLPATILATLSSIGDLIKYIKEKRHR